MLNKAILFISNLVLNKDYKWYKVARINKINFLWVEVHIVASNVHSISFPSQKKMGIYETRGACRNYHVKKIRHYYKVENDKKP